MIYVKRIIFVIFFNLVFLNSVFGAENFFEEAKKKFEKKDYEKSKFLFQRNIVFNPKDAKSYLYLAKIFKNEDNQEEEEKNSFVSFIEKLLEHLELYPDAKFYHYFSYEISSLRSSAQNFGVYEKELEQLIEKKCFIDLFSIVNSSLLIGASSYSLKTVEKLAGINRTEDLQSGMESIQYFEDYFFNEEYELKDLIIEYNKADCKNLYLLHDWLASLL